MYRIDFDAVDMQWQIEMLKLFPEIANKYFYPAMHRATSEIKVEVQGAMRFHDRTGTARSDFRKAVSGKGLNITGRVGWPYGTKAWYVNVLEHGARAHEVGYVPDLGVRIDKHPGIPAMRFLENGRQAAEGVTNREMETAASQTVNELAKDS